MMRLTERCTTWLETHWVNPAYSGWVMSGLAIFFFGAATNTMAGWLYVISGILVAVLGLGAVLPLQTLRGIRLRRAPIAAVSVGEPLILELVIENLTNRPKTLIQLQDDLPQPLLPIRTVIEQISAHGSYCWATELLTHQRGVFHWQTVQLRTAAPLGLFWCRRNQAVLAKAVVYPAVLPLRQCPLIDQMGQDNLQQRNHNQSRLATEGLTRTLRPYRWGDSTRLIHWRNSARYGELRVRELETVIDGQELVIGLDSALAWDAACFEQAVVAAASLYFYALRHQFKVGLWTAGTGLVSERQAVLEVLAAVQPGEHFVNCPVNSPINRPLLPLLWLTQSTAGLATLPSGSRWLLWQPSDAGTSFGAKNDWLYPGILIQAGQPLQAQLQRQC